MWAAGSCGGRRGGGVLTPRPARVGGGHRRRAAGRGLSCSRPGSGPGTQREPGGWGGGQPEKRGGRGQGRAIGKEQPSAGSREAAPASGPTAGSREAVKLLCKRKRRNRKDRELRAVRSKCPLSAPGEPA